MFLLGHVIVLNLSKAINLLALFLEKFANRVHILSNSQLPHVIRYGENVYKLQSTNDLITQVTWPGRGIKLLTLRYAGCQYYQLIYQTQFKLIDSDIKCDIIIICCFLWTKCIHKILIPVHLLCCIFQTQNSHL